MLHCRTKYTLTCIRELSRCTAGTATNITSEQVYQGGNKSGQDPAHGQGAAQNSDVPAKTSCYTSYGTYYQR